MEKCKICNESFSDENTLVVLRAKGSNGVNCASAQRGISLVTIPGDRVHIECRRNYCKAENIVCDNVIPSLQQPQIKHNLRSEQNFNFQEHCLFCGQPTEIDKKNKHREKMYIYQVRTGDFQERIVQVCHLRNDEWSDTVLGRISSVHLTFMQPMQCTTTYATVTFENEEYSESILCKPRQQTQKIQSRKT